MECYYIQDLVKNAEEFQEGEKLGEEEEEEEEEGKGGHFTGREHHTFAERSKANDSAVWHLRLRMLYMYVVPLCFRSPPRGSAGRHSGIEYTARLTLLPWGTSARQ